MGNGVRKLTIEGLSWVIQDINFLKKQSDRLQPPEFEHVLGDIEWSKNHDSLYLRRSGEYTFETHTIKDMRNLSNLFVIGGNINKMYSQQTNVYLTLDSYISLQNYMIYMHEQVKILASLSEEHFLNPDKLESVLRYLRLKSLTLDIPQLRVGNTILEFDEHSGNFNVVVEGVKAGIYTINPRGVAYDTNIVGLDKELEENVKEHIGEIDNLEVAKLV